MQLQNWRDKQIIKVITGVRRCGKSVLMEMYAEQLKAQGVPADRIIQVNLENLDFEALCQPTPLHSYSRNDYLRLNHALGFILCPERSDSGLFIFHCSFKRA